MWIIPLLFAVVLLVPSALIAACNAHDAATGRPDHGLGDE